MCKDELSCAAWMLRQIPAAVECYKPIVLAHMLSYVDSEADRMENSYVSMQAQAAVHAV